MKPLMKFKSFRKCQAGNVSMMFAAALLPIMGTVGFAVDFSRASEVKSQLAAAVDSTALALSHASVTLTDAQLQAKANDLFKSNFKPGTPANSSSVKASRDTGALTVNASAAFQTSFLRVLNVSTLDVTAKSKVVWGSKQKIEVVLALDNTGSMKGNKLAELKKAATELVNTLEAAQTPGKADSVKVGIVPFATTVRVDPKADLYKKAKWIRFDDVQYDEKVCEWKKRNGEWREECHYETKTRDFSKTNWQGCIQDRDQPYDVDDTKYDAKKNGQALYPAVEACPADERDLQIVQPLTNKFGDLRNAIDKMQAAGKTNVTIGIAWGLSLLSHQEPFQDGSAETKGENAPRKFLIVLTDGENTENRFGDNTGGAIDARTKLACKAARDMGTVFTIRMIDGDASLLQGCASTTDNYYDVQDAANLKDVFRAVGNEIANLRVAE
jgi:Flp pilus assembly protein TadG